MALLAQTAERARPIILAGERILPVAPELAGLLPWGGLRRGATVTVAGSTSLLLALLAAVVAQGSWAAVVGQPSLGVAAADEAGVALQRLALVPEPGPEWPAVVAALLDGLDLVVVDPPRFARPADARRLSARVRERGAVLVVTGEQAARWEGADVRFSVAASRWEGLGDGHGHLAARQVEVRTTGRGAAVRPRTARLWLPASGRGVGEVGPQVTELRVSG